MKETILRSVCGLKPLKVLVPSKPHHVSPSNLASVLVKKKKQRKRKTHVLDMTTHLCQRKNKFKYCYNNKLIVTAFSSSQSTLNSSSNSAKLNLSSTSLRRSVWKKSSSRNLSLRKDMNRKTHLHHSSNLSFSAMIYSSLVLCILHCLLVLPSETQALMSRSGGGGGGGGGYGGGPASFEQQQQIQQQDDGFGPSGPSGGGYGGGSSSSGDTKGSSGGKKIQIVYIKGLLLKHLLNYFNVIQWLSVF